MDDFRGIIEESFPSFLTSSLLGNSGTLENVTLTSNLGLPVAVSTLAKNRSISDNRYADAQASYLAEERFSLPSASPPSSQSETEPKERLQLSFRDDEKKSSPEGRHVSDAPLSERAFHSAVAGKERKSGTAQTAHAPQSQDLFGGSSPPEQEQDSPIIFCLPSWMSNTENKVAVAVTGKHLEDQALNSDLSHASLLENEKLVSLASMEDSSDDDIDDEEFYDAHLEAYFEQLAIPGMIYEDLEGQGSSDKEFKLPTSDSSQANENTNFGSKSQSGNSGSLPSCGSNALGRSVRPHRNSEDGLVVHVPGSTVSPFSSGSLRVEEKQSVENLKSTVSEHCGEADSLHDNKSLVSDSEMALPVDSCLDTETPKAAGQASSKPIGDSGMTCPITSWSPTSSRRICERFESVEKSNAQTDLKSQSVVYQNEEGKWVTDLAYYTSFNNERELNALTTEMNEDFQSGSEALDLIAHDEEEFNKEHQFMQEENMDTQEASLVLGAKGACASDTGNEDASYLHLSLGEFFAQRSEALGCLGGGYDVKRPSFGYFITSPEMREPVALLRQSDLSARELEGEVAQLPQEQVSGDAHERPRSQPSEGSVTLQAEALETVSQVDDNEVTLTAQKSRTEDTFFPGSKTHRHNGKRGDGEESVLRISTIASAIADASLSTEPLQLAAMMKALSNKPREDNRPHEGSAMSSFLPNDVEKSSGSNVFDMEKYLKKTEVSPYGSGLESFARGGLSSIWDLSLPKEQRAQESSAVHAGAADASARQPGEHAAAAFRRAGGQSESQGSLDTREPSGRAGASERGRASVDDQRSPPAGSGTKATPSGSAPSSSALERSSRVATHWLCDEFPRLHGAGQQQNEPVGEVSSSEGREALEAQSPPAPGVVDRKNASPKLAGCVSEDELDSFRPSILPLSHSSPSEISGTSLPGCALGSLASAAPPQRSTCESEPCPSVCLTYVSEWESMWSVTAPNLGSEDHKAQNSINSESSTSFIHASPVPLEERGVESFRDQASFPSGGQGASAPPLQNHEDANKVGAAPCLGSPPEAPKPAVGLRKALPVGSVASAETLAGGVASDPSGQVSRGFQSGASLDRPSGSRPAHPTPSLPASAEEGPRIMREDPSTAASALSGQTLHPIVPGSHCPPLLISMVGPDAAPHRQGVPPEVPARPTQHPVPPLPFTLQYSGAVPAAGNAALPPCPASGSAVSGLLGSRPYPPGPGEQVPGSVAPGVCLGQNVNSGLLGSSSLYDLYPKTLDQHLLSTRNPLPVQSVGANYAVERWDSEVMSEFGKVKVPEELRFPHACCIGIASQTLLSLLNPTDHWLQVSIGVLSVSINNEKVDLSTYPCLVFKNKAIIRPYASEEIKILFIPCSAGVFRCMFSVASWRFSADADTIVQAEALASRVVLTAIAEAPVIEVETEKEDGLDFGDMIYGGWKALPLKLINKTHASVPIRLIINANAAAWRCFTLSKDPILASLKAAPYTDVLAQLPTPSVINLMMPASSEGQDPEFQTAWVLFHSPKKQITSAEVLGSAEEFLASVDIELDSPNPTSVIQSVGLRARTGVARIHAPKDLQTMHLCASVSSSAKQHLPLKNAGNIGVHLDIKISDQGSDFAVGPEKLFLKPGEEHDVLVSFTPKDPKPCEERVLKIFVEPFGPQYEVALKGEVVSRGADPPASEPCCSVPPILSNKQFLAWGGVPLGMTQLQKLTLRNNSASVSQHLRLVIRGQDQDCFQLQHTFGSEERLTSNCEIRIHTKEDINISVLFTPTRLSCMLAKLEIKNLGIQSQPGIKFTIPLSGYGGTSNLILEDVKKLSDSYMITVKDLIPGKASSAVFAVRNTGSRAAFVKVVGFKDSEKKLLLDPQVLSIFPDKFVLKENTQEEVTIIYNPPHRDCNYKTTTEMSTIYFFSGDEILRQRFRRVLVRKPGVLEQILPENSMLQNIDFAETFEDELLVTEVYDLPQRPNDIQIFYGNMHKMVLSVIGEFQDSASSKEFLKFSSGGSLESQSSGKHGGNVSLDVLPVKGPQGPPLPQAVPPPQAKSDSEETWTVQPEHLILVAPSSCGLAGAGHFQIVNHSARLLRFELYWPAHCLTVTPQHGFLSPQSKLQILVSPNSSLSTDKALVPWNGVIYVHCDNGQKNIVKVQIREALTQEEVPPRSSSALLGSAPQGAVSRLSELLPKPPSTKVEIRNKSVTFPATEPGNTSENYLELENRGNTQVKWHLSSLAPPYVKGVDESGDVFRATYAAFICSPISGVLGSHGVQKVAITFLPRDRGDYAQFWDVECHPLKETHMKHTLRFQLTGHSVKAETKPAKSSSSTSPLVRIENLVKPQRRAASEASAVIPTNQLDLTHRGVYAPKDEYRFLPTQVGDTKTLKINLRNNSFITHTLKFLSPREPFYVKHSKYSLRAQHYINMPIQFKPKSAGTFEALLVIQTDGNKSLAIRLKGDALGKN